ncbi:MAG: M23 family metallopeptidase [Janthinobacterium lividum]
MQRSKNQSVAGQGRAQPCMPGRRRATLALAAFASAGLSRFGAVFALEPADQPVREVMRFGLTVSAASPDSSTAALRSAASRETSAVGSQLYLTAEAIGVPEAMVDHIVQIFSGRLDFHRDLEAGFDCTVLYQMEFEQGMIARPGKILAVRLVMPASTEVAYLFDDAGTRKSMSGKPPVKTGKAASLAARHGGVKRPLSTTVDNPASALGAPGLPDASTSPIARSATTAAAATTATTAATATAATAATTATAATSPTLATAATVTTAMNAATPVTFSLDDYYDAGGRSLGRHFLQSPIQFTRITSGYAVRRFHPILKLWRSHTGTDFAAPIGTPVRVTADGVVRFAGVQGGYGNLVIVDHANGLSSRYGHLSAFAPGLRRGSLVAQGDLLARVGMTGLATGPHLHYEMRRAEVPFDPATLDSTSAISARQLAPASLARFNTIKAIYERQLAVPSRTNVVER